MPGVMRRTRVTRASTASITASLTPIAGTKTTETSAPVAAMVCSTVPKTGTDAVPKSTVWPAFRGLVPPTTLVPAASMRRPGLRPSDPVMPWMRTRLCPVRKIAISCSRRCQLAVAPRRVVHVRDLLDDADPRLGQDPAALGRVLAVQPHHDRAAHRLAALGHQAA